jgi:hypothetical protein
MLSVEGRGVNASVLEKDIGTMNGVIHVIDRQDTRQSISILKRPFPRFFQLRSSQQIKKTLKITFIYFISEKGRFRALSI